MEHESVIAVRRIIAKEADRFYRQSFLDCKLRPANGADDGRSAPGGFICSMRLGKVER